MKSDQGADTQIGHRVLLEREGCWGQEGLKVIEETEGTPVYR